MQGALQDMIPDLYRYLFIMGLDLWFAELLIVDKDNPEFKGPVVQAFAQAIGSHLTIQDINLPVLILFFKFNGALDRVGAADPGAVVMCFIP